MINKFTAEQCYESGQKNSELATQAKKANTSQEMVDDCGRAAAIDFWFALTMGHEKAPFALSECFGQGVGVPKNPYLEQLLFGVALKLTPETCDQVPAEKKPTIPELIQPNIDALVQLMKDTLAQLPKYGVDADKFNDQLTKFNNTIELPSGEKIQSYFIDTVNEVNVKETKTKAKSLISTLKKGDNRKIYPCTTNHVPLNSKKTRGKSGCIIS